MKSNYTTEQVNGILAEWKELVFKNHFSEQDFDKFKKSHGLIPTLEVGKWYKYTDEENWMIYIKELKDGKPIGSYGFNTLSHWMDTWHCNGIEELDGLVEVPTEEVETALKAEAIKRGFKEGVIVECLTWGNKPCIVDGRYPTGERFMFYQNSGEIWTCVEKEQANCIFKEGVWATIIETKVLELTMSELEDKYGCKVKIIKE